LEAVQQAFGVTWAQAVGWLGPSLAALWFWTGEREPKISYFPQESPLAWAHEFFDAAGFSGQSLLAASQWLHVRDGLYPLWLAAAVLLASHAVADRHSGALMSLATLCLMVTFELGDPTRSIALFVFLSLLLCVVAIILDAVGERGEERTYLCIPRISLARWTSGPGWVAFGMLLLPLIFLAGAVDAYRVVALPRPPRLPTGARPLSQGIPVATTHEDHAPDETQLARLG
jgi:hypothetical protein